ncbi:MAG TPA: helix-turn-helix domain-containing protein [Gemmataceae bacterium]|nr:helix-turn-helix domain-containing protein [Gemmataceae bacterium]
MQTLAQWVSLPENRSALAAVERVADSVLASGGRKSPEGDRIRGLTPPARLEFNPLFLHGPAGVGKTHLVAGLAARVAERQPGSSVVILTAGDFDRDPQEAAADLAAARRADLAAVEDVHRLSARAVEAVVQLLDRGLARQVPLIFTAAVGPARLELPARLVSRLAAGLIVGLELLGPASRFAFLEDRIARKGLNVERAVLNWLTQNIGGSGRELDGAVARLETLSRMHGGAVGLEIVVESFRTDAEARRATVERIAQRVGRYFRIGANRLQGRDRSRQTLLPRQIGMYLARRLTDLSLEQIGAYFGGRDHSTVLHACRKVERALADDLVLSGAVRELQTDLR